MTAFIQASIEAEDVTNTMSEDNSFAHDLWMELAQKLDMGVLLDDACDIFSNDVEKAKYVGEQFSMLGDFIRARHVQLSEQGNNAFNLTFEPDTVPDAIVAKSGQAIVGRIFPPLGANGKRQWRMWLNGNHTADVGTDADLEAAKKSVQTKWTQFLVKTGLTKAQAVEGETPVDRLEVQRAFIILREARPASFPSAVTKAEAILEEALKG